MSDETTDVTPDEPARGATAMSAPDAAHHPGDTGEVVSTVRRRRTGSGGFFGAWIGIGAMIGLLIGVFLATTTDGPPLVSAQRSVMWLGVFFAALGALIGAVVAVAVDAAAQRRR